MRRARIKAVATVPVRRKTVQDCTPAAPVVQTDATESEKLPNVTEESKNETVTAVEQEKHVDVTQSPLKPTISPVKESQQNSEAKIVQDVTESPHEALISTSVEKESSEPNLLPSEELVPKNNLQQPSNTEISQKSTVAPVESSSTKSIQNRSHFMRPTPRLDGGSRIRRNSIQGSGASASESEDDSRRSNTVVPSRVRSDSVSSILSLKDTGSAGNPKLNLAAQKRRMVVSESARKLAEARREFQLKYEKNPPDKSKLKMYDLIFYNPVTNPMKPKPSANRQAARRVSICSVPERREEELVDEPEEMLVPQVKVGPNGQLILDEQSLVIDQYKGLENIDRSDILVDEETNTGFYKRRSKSKDWNKWETLKFYKALSTYGTDFLLMQSVFPTRTRQELKLKYKKEEKVNINLVEKALKYQEFDTEALEKDLEKVAENERLESESLKRVKEKKKDKEKKRKRNRCQKLLEEISCEGEEPNSEANKNSYEGKSSDEEKIEKPAPKKRRTTRKRKIVLPETNSSNESLGNDSDSDPDLYEFQTTRSGRTSKKTKKVQKSKRTVNSKKQSKDGSVTKINYQQNNNEAEDPTEIEEIIQSNAIVEKEDEAGTAAVDKVLGALKTGTNISTVTDDISNIENLKPGSCVVVTKDNVDEPGKKTLQVYVVSSDYDAGNSNNQDNLLPLTLTPDVMETVINYIQDI